MFSALHFAAPDALSAAASYVGREYGHHGYRIGHAQTFLGVAVFEVVASDGARFNIAADRWGNVSPLADDDTIAEVIAQMARQANAA